MGVADKNETRENIKTFDKDYNESKPETPINTAIDGGIVSQNPNPASVESSSPAKSGSPSYDKLTKTLDATPVTSFAETGFGEWNKNLTFAGSNDDLIPTYLERTNSYLAESSPFAPLKIAITKPRDGAKEVWHMSQESYRRYFAYGKMKDFVAENPSYHHIVDHAQKLKGRLPEEDFASTNMRVIDHNAWKLIRDPKTAMNTIMGHVYDILATEVELPESFMANMKKAIDENDLIMIRAYRDRALRDLGKNQDSDQLN